jgi:hypothetical protein
MYTYIYHVLINPTTHPACTLLPVGRKKYEYTYICNTYIRVHTYVFNLIFISFAIYIEIFYKIFYYFFPSLYIEKMVANDLRPPFK